MTTNFLKQSLLLLAFWVLLYGVYGCKTSNADGANSADAKKGWVIVTTTGMIADAMEHIVGDKGRVSSLMGAGVDPHLYKATQSDLTRLQSADIVVYNGLHLEGKMAEVLERLNDSKPSWAFADGLDPNLLIGGGVQGSSYDPHIWFDASLWAQGVIALGEKMAAFDPPQAQYYRSRANSYRDSLLQLHSQVKDSLSTIAPERRVLITSHDAFRYFGRAYGLEVRGLQGISTQSDFGLRDVSLLTDFIVERRIKALFVESSVSPKSIEAVRDGCAKKGHRVAMGGTLYSDAMGTAGTPEGTYSGMMWANVNLIVKALK